MSFINPTPGSAGVEALLTLTNVADVSTTSMTVPAMQDITVNNANDVFSWTQLDSGSKFQLATTSTNDISINIVVDQTTFFGTVDDATQVSSDTASELGIFGLSKLKSKVSFTLYLGSTDAGVVADGKTISGTGYLTGIALTTSADSPIFVTPVTLSVSGDYTVA